MLFTSTDMSLGMFFAMYDPFFDGRFSDEPLAVYVYRSRNACGLFDFESL